MNMFQGPTVTGCIVLLIAIVLTLAWFARKKYPRTIRQVELPPVQQSPYVPVPAEVAEPKEAMKGFDVEEKDSLDKHLDMLTKSLAEKEGRLRISKSKFREKKMEIENLNTIDDSLKEKYDEIMDNLRRDLATNEKECKKLQDRIEWVSQQRAELKEEICEDCNVVGKACFMAPTTQDFEKTITCCCVKQQVHRNRMQGPPSSQRSSTVSRSRSCISKQSGSRRKDLKKRISKIDCPYSDLIVNIDDILRTMKRIDYETNAASTRQPPRCMNLRLSCPKTCIQFATKKTLPQNRKHNSTSPLLNGAENHDPKPSRKKIKEPILSIHSPTQSSDNSTGKPCICPSKSSKKTKNNEITSEPTSSKRMESEPRKKRKQGTDNTLPLPSPSAAPNNDLKTSGKKTAEDRVTKSTDSPTLSAFLSTIKPCPCSSQSSKKSKIHEINAEQSSSKPMESEIKPPSKENQQPKQIQIENSKTLHTYMEYVPSCPKDCFPNLLDEEGGFVNPSFKESTSRMTIDTSSHSFGRIVEEELRYLTPMKKRKAMIKILEQIED